jgi:hypothetical protein
MGADGLRAECSHCDYARRFSPELSGRFFRCPKCRQGVLSVPRASSEDQQRWRSSEERWLVVSEDEGKGSRAKPPKGDPSETPGPIVTLGKAAQATQRDEALDRKKQPFKPKAAEPESSASTPGGADLDSGSDPARAAISADHPDDEDEGKESRSNKGEVATVRRILVECGLCGFLVRIPPAFFGKTIHCPECAGDTIFSESALEPVKDELVDRMALETAERDVLFRLASPREERWSTARSFLVGVALGLVAIAGIWGFLAARQGAARDAAVEQALRDGWRWATLEGDPFTLHEPWCRELTRVGSKVSQAERDRRPELKPHDCY